ncbi:MAG: hypothetical protein ACHREM_22870, partial [Polyangiales bacterium]
MSDQSKSSRRTDPAAPAAREARRAPSANAMRAIESSSKTNPRIDVVKQEGDKPRAADLAQLHKALTTLHHRLATAEAELAQA